MKGIGKVIMAMLLAIAICLGTIPTQSAYAQGVGVSVGIDVNQTIDEILDLFAFEGKRFIVVINKTRKDMTREGAYNKTGNWPAGDVPGKTAKIKVIIGTQPGNRHSFAANYRVTDGDDIYFQFGSEWPLIGKRKIILCAKNMAGNDPAKECWKQMKNADDVNLKNQEYLGSALLKSIKTPGGAGLAWVYEVQREENRHPFQFLGDLGQRVHKSFKDFVQGGSK